MENEKKVRKVKKEVKENKSDKKVVIKDKKKFLIAFGVFALIIAIVVIIICTRKPQINENSNISELNVNKYGEEIKKEYEEEGKDLVFKKDWDEIQDAVGKYLIQNYPLESADVPIFLAEISDLLKGNDWSRFEIKRNTMWNGTWDIDETGRVKFKFSDKSIEPSWVQNYSEQGYIILN